MSKIQLIIYSFSQQVIDDISFKAGEMLLFWRTQSGSAAHIDAAAGLMAILRNAKSSFTNRNVFLLMACHMFLLLLCVSLLYLPLYSSAKSDRHNDRPIIGKLTAYLRVIYYSKSSKLTCSFTSVLLLLLLLLLLYLCGKYDCCSFGRCAGSGGSLTQA